MKNLHEFIMESEMSDKKKEILKELKGSYPDYVEKLNEMVKDPKSKALIDDAFGGDLGDMKLKMTIQDISAAALMPTQNEIDVSKSLSYAMKPNADCSAMFKEPITLKIPLVTYNGTFIIDGHHRWSQIACYNPEGRMKCMNFQGNASPIQILKAVQGCIAAAEGEVPSNKVTGTNIYDMSRKDAERFFEENLTDAVYENLSKYIECQDRNDLVSILVDNVMTLQTDHPLMKYAPERGVMPQTDKSKDANPNIEGSALNILATKKVLKVPGNK